MATSTHIRTERSSPLAAYRALRGDGPAFLLESGARGRLGRFSLIGAGARLVPFAEAEGEVDAGHPVAGYLGYDHVASLEPVPLPGAGPPFPESRFVVADTLLRFDHATGTAEVLAGAPDRIEARLSAAGADDDAEIPVGPSRTASAGWTRSPSRSAYEDGVRRAKEHITAGDAYQVVLSQRAERPTEATPLGVYTALRRINPSPYLFLLELGDLSLVGSSPETLVKLEGRRASTNPIAGTVTPGPDDGERLLTSAKDRSEHVMLVDLGRNDLARVCVAGSVRVTRFLEPERYSHVTHLVSEVTGTLEPGTRPFDVLRACFPAGTVSGAPKIRAMQLISEIERYRRGPYAGGVGYVLPDGTLDACIAIRMVVLAGGVARIQAGAGIVAASAPAAEHRECLAKLAALEQAVVEAEGAAR